MPAALAMVRATSGCGRASHHLNQQREIEKHGGKDGITAGESLPGEDLKFLLLGRSIKLFLCCIATAPSCKLYGGASR